MTDAQHLERMAEMAGLNPYWLAYVIDTGMNNADGFLIWNALRWRETRQRLGLSGCAPASHRVADHLETLATHLGDKLTALLPAKAAA